MGDDGGRRVVLVAQRASGSGRFRLDDIPSTSGRLDVHLRCLRAAFLLSHGLRRDVTVELVLLGDREAPRVVRLVGASLRFLRPDERAMAVLMQKILTAEVGSEGWHEVRPGCFVSRGGTATLEADWHPENLLWLDETGEDLRAASLAPGPVTLVLGDHHGLDDDTRAILEGRGAKKVSIGPLSVHADDALAVAFNELDRRASAR